jgi:uncharacterized protein
MIQPIEMKLNLPIDLSNKQVSDTAHVWDMLVASSQGNLERVKKLAEECPELVFAQYNYTPPIHFAAREGHLELVNYFLGQGAYDPIYKTYPFLDSLPIIADDRGRRDIAILLRQFGANYSLHKYKGDNGEIHYNRTVLQKEFEKAVNKEDLNKIEKLLKKHPELAKDETFFWSEGILTMPAKRGNRKLMELLMSYGAKVPDILKWAQFYYFERYDSAAFLLEKGMNPNTMSWHHVTVLHDMAQKGEIQKAELLIKHGADINAVEEEYQSTPLGLAVRWGQVEMVEFLLKQGADPKKSGAAWSTPFAWSQKKGHKAIENILLKKGAKENTKQKKH